VRKKSMGLVRLCIVVLSVVLLASCSVLNNEKLDEKTTSMINAFISKNAEETKAQTHPDYVDSINNLDKLFEAMANDGIILDGNLSKLVPTSRSYSAFDSEFDGKTTYSIYDATIGDMEYVIKVRTLENDNGYGIINFDIGLTNKFSSSSE